jgi:hypothetical protein
VQVVAGFNLPQVQVTLLADLFSGSVALARFGCLAIHVLSIHMCSGWCHRSAARGALHYPRKLTGES